MHRMKFAVLTAMMVLGFVLPGVSQTNSAPAAPAKPPVNYLIKVQWKDAKGTSQHIDVLTTEGKVQLNTALGDKVKIDENEIPVTVTFNAALRSLGPDKCQVDFFLGRTMPYITGTSFGPGQSRSQYQERQIGFNTSVVATLGKTLVVQSDSNAEVSLLVKLQE